MRAAFPEFYGPDDQQMKGLLTSGLLVLDTNVLFELYRMTTPDREEVQGLLQRHFEGSVWIPWRVGFEFHRKRLGIVRGQAGHYESAREFGRTDEVDLLKELRGLQLPDAVASSVEKLIPDLVSAIEDARTAYRSAVRDLTNQHVITPEAAIENDPVLRWLTDLIGDNVGDRWDQGRSDEEQKRGLQRIADKIPPGFKDAGKGNESDQVGDYLIWRQILDKAAQLSKDGSAHPGILFVSNDVKDDWVEKSGGRVIGPRSELRAEFQEAWLGGIYHQVNLGGLLELAKAHLEAEISPEAVQRVNDLEVAQRRVNRTNSWAEVAERDPDAVFEVAQRLLTTYPGNADAQAAANELMSLSFGLSLDDDAMAKFRGADLNENLEWVWPGDLPAAESRRLSREEARSLRRHWHLQKYDRDMFKAEVPEDPED
jgi:PIN like domain